MKTYINVVATVTLFLMLGSFGVQAAPAMKGPLCGLVGTVDSVEFQKSKSTFLGKSVTNEYYKVTLTDRSIDVPDPDSLDAYASILGWDRDKLVGQHKPAQESSVCVNAYGAQGTFAADEYIYSYYNDQSIEEGQKIKGLIEHGGDERLAGVFLKGVVVTDGTTDNGNKEETNNQEKRTLQLSLINLLKRLLSLLSL